MPLKGIVLTKKSVFHQNGKLPIKHMANIEKNGFHFGQWFPLNGMASITMNNFHQKKGLSLIEISLPLKGMASPKRNSLN